MLCYVMLCYVMLCYVMSCHVMSCHVMSCHVMSCHVLLNDQLLGFDKTRVFCVGFISGKANLNMTRDQIPINREILH